MNKNIFSFSRISLKIQLFQLSLCIAQVHIGTLIWFSEVFHIAALFFGRSAKFA
jgi:hypothetical protein